MSDLLSFVVTYDRRADTLYITQPIAASRGELDEVGIVWRYGPDGALVGATVMDFRELWTAHQEDLARRLALAFSAPLDQALMLVSKGLGPRAAH
jgi:hypothetical protein